VHSAATLLLAILAAEKSKVPFYIAGGVLATWAVILSMAIGMRRGEFPYGPGGQRIVIAISALLVAGAIGAAVATSGSPAKTGVASAASTPPSSAAGAQSAPAESAASAPAPAPAAQGSVKPSGKKAKATTGSPAPPSSPASKTPSAIALSANPGGLLSFDKKQLSAKAGAVTITLTNTAPLEHNVAVAQGSNVLGSTPTFAGGSRTLTLTLAPGTYTFYCTVPGHRQAGMEGTLTVA
jgi:plastocyanin